MLILPRRITSKIRYWRTGRGYGVHSPFAYHFITRVLRERLPYYDFDKLGELPIRVRHARLLYRLTDFFQPATAWVGGEYAAEARVVIQMAHPSVRFAESSADADMAVSVFPLCQICAGREVTVAFEADRSTADDFVKSFERGMTFSNGRVMVAVNRHGLPRQDFRLRF